MPGTSTPCYEPFAVFFFLLPALSSLLSPSFHINNTLSPIDFPKWRRFLKKKKHYSGVHPRVSTNTTKFSKKKKKKNTNIPPRRPMMQMCSHKTHLIVRGRVLSSFQRTAPYFGSRPDTILFFFLSPPPQISIQLCLKASFDVNKRESGALHSGGNYTIPNNLSKPSDFFFTPRIWRVQDGPLRAKKKKKKTRGKNIRWNQNGWNSGDLHKLWQHN